MQPLFIFDDSRREAAVRRLLSRLPPLSGKPVQIRMTRGLRDRHGAVHAGAFLRERRILFDCSRAEFPRIFIHELFHFIWVRRGNALRRSYEELVRRECIAGSMGELGWSAEWRRRALRQRDILNRTRRWREYCCESFCDSAAWLYAGIARHREFTLEGPFRAPRRAWFRKNLESVTLSI